MTLSGPFSSRAFVLSFGALVAFQSRGYCSRMRFFGSVNVVRPTNGTLALDDAARVGGDSVAPVITDAGGRGEEPTVAGVVADPVARVVGLDVDAGVGGMGVAVASLVL